MDSWQRFDETSLPDKKEFYNNLAMENIVDADCKDAEKVWNQFRIQNLGEYHDLYVQSNSNTLLLADVFKNSYNKCVGIYKLDPANFLQIPGLAWQACLKKKKK